MKRTATIIMILGLIASPLCAAMTIYSDSDNKLSTGGLMQFLGQSTRSTQSDTWQRDYYIKTARLNFKYAYKNQYELFTQTEVSGTDAVNQGYDMRVIDAYGVLSFSPVFQIYHGMHLAPANRQVLMSSSALMAIDRPGIANKSLSWGGAAKSGFNRSSIGALGCTNNTLVRDIGATLFGNYSFNPTFHTKYYLGAYKGAQSSAYSGERLTARVQFNWLEPEPDYYYKSTYLGTKQTVGLGFSYDLQPSVGSTQLNASETADYSYYSVDFFCEQPIGSDSITVEAAYSALNMQDKLQLSEGTGYYMQTGYYLKSLQLQPWIDIERWSAKTNNGGLQILRIGATYFINGHNLNLKAGLEKDDYDSGARSWAAMMGIFTAF